MGLETDLRDWGDELRMIAACEPGETPADAVEREAREETGLTVRATTWWAYGTPGAVAPRRRRQGRGEVAPQACRSIVLYAEVVALATASA